MIASKRATDDNRRKYGQMEAMAAKLTQDIVSIAG